MIRVIVNGVSFYTTKRAIRESRVGDSLFLNDRLRDLYLDMIRRGDTGVCTKITAYDSKMRRESYDIQINK